MGNSESGALGVSTAPAASGAAGDADESPARRLQSFTPRSHAKRLQSQPGIQRAATIARSSTIARSNTIAAQPAVPEDPRAGLRMDDFDGVEDGESAENPVHVGDKFELWYHGAPKKEPPFRIGTVVKVFGRRTRTSDGGADGMSPPDVQRSARHSKGDPSQVMRYAHLKFADGQTEELLLRALREAVKHAREARDKVRTSSSSSSLSSSQMRTGVVACWLASALARPNEPCRVSRTRCWRVPFSSPPGTRLAKNVSPGFCMHARTHALRKKRCC
jgi:hypothetical protein